jgi:lipoprotein NlpD
MNLTAALSSLRAASAAVLIALVAAACTAPVSRAPVEDRSAVSRPPPPVAVLPATPASAPEAMVEPPAKPVPGVENLGKPGYYAVKPGDTLLRIALEHGQNARDLARWNNLENPNVLEVGQVLRVVPPGVDPTAVATKGVNTAKVETRPLDNRAPGNGAVAGAASAPPASIPPGAAALPPPAASPAPAATPSADDDVAWAWPTTASVSLPFDESRNKGLVFNGKAGDPVLAAADGRVVYAGSGLRGYGNLVIVKHNNTYLTAYAHNQTLLVKEDQAVRRGQKIAEMGSSDADRVQLHFEIRRLGKPVDPARLLPPR